ncbi:MAG: class I SAM-dependent methyltransferase [Acidobacteriales bacterium]|nr:class I SAM-dependent methyltransferase [Terriglobales bacterium]
MERAVAASALWRAMMSGTSAKTGLAASASEYALGYTDAEHDRLMRQARWLAPLTGGFFRKAGIGRGQRVLDLGSGVGDVSFLLADLVGPSGSVVGIEKDSRSIALARERAEQYGFRHVSFQECDCAELKSAEPFDAVVGRFILMFLPEPVAVLRAAFALLKPGGVFAFQEVNFDAFLRSSAGLPLWSAAGGLFEQAIRLSGANTRMGPALQRVFMEAGMPAPIEQSDDYPGGENWLPDLLTSALPQIERHSLSLDSVGDLATLNERLLAELDQTDAPMPFPAIVSAWSRKPRM